MNIKDCIFSFIVNVLTILALVFIVWAAISFYGKKENKELLNPIEFKYKGHDMIKFNSTIVHSPECKKCHQTHD